MLMFLVVSIHFDLSSRFVLTDRLASLNVCVMVPFFVWKTRFEIDDLCKVMS